jgi:hypothetical protein
MKPGNHHRILTVSEAVREAAAICDPDGTVTAVTALYEAFEDDDRPATAAEDLRGELLSTVDGIDPDGSEPAAAATAATAFWLATNPDQADAGDHAVEEGVKLAYEGDPPEPLSGWLAGGDGAS